MRRVIGWLLVTAAAAALFPRVVSVSAIQQGWVETPATDPALYRITAGSSLVRCAVPSTIVLQVNTTTPDSFFECVNSYGAPVTLNWSVQDDGGGGFLTAAGSDTLAADGLAACRTASLIAGGTEATRTVVFRGATEAGAGFYVELHFTGQVTVQAGTTGLGGGCP